MITLKDKIMTLMEENDICDILHIIADALQIGGEDTEIEIVGLEVEEAADHLREVSLEMPVSQETSS